MKESSSGIVITPRASPEEVGTVGSAAGHSRAYSKIVAAALSIIFLVLAAFYSIATPPWEAPDEVAHYSYVLTLLTTHRLPVQRVGDLGESQMPPLYYLLAAAAALPSRYQDQTGAFRPNPRFIWAGNGGREPNAAIHTTSETFPFQGQALTYHLAAAASVVLGAITVALVVALGWEVFPERPEIGLLGAALAAFDPQYLFIAGAINNDNLLATASTGAIWQSIRAMKAPEKLRGWIWLGIWLVVAVLAKPTGLVIGLVAGIVLVACAVRTRSFVLFARGALAMGAVVLLGAGWWFARNQILYGDPLGWGVFQTVFAQVMRKTPLTLGDLIQFYSVQFRSFFGVFGWMDVFAPNWFYVGARVLCGLGLLGLIVFFLRGGFAKLAGHQRSSVGVLLLAVVAQEGFMLDYITHCDGSCYQGRYLFPVIGPLMLLLALGLLALVPRPIALPTSALLTAVLLGVAVWSPLGLIAPAYHIVPLPKSALWSVPNKLSADEFGDQFQLAAYRVDQSSDKSSLSVMLYWQARRKPQFDYSSFVHLIDDQDRIVAQEDQAPGAKAGYPPTAWWPGDIVADPHALHIPPNLPSGSYRLRIGLYNWQNGVQLPVRVNGRAAGTFVILPSTIQRAR